MGDLTYTEILDFMVRFEQIINRMKSYQAKPQDYGTGDQIYHSELQLIKAINNHPNYNISDFSEMFSITKGAVSQTTNKLVDRGYIRKFKYEDNKKEVFLKLTDKGKIVYDGAYASYSDIINNIIEFAGEDGSNLKAIYEFFDFVDDILDEVDD